MTIHMRRRDVGFRTSNIGSERKLNILGIRTINNLLPGLSLTAMDEDAGTT